MLLRVKFLAHFAAVLGLRVWSCWRAAGRFRLQPGQWTDDTSMALCLAESLVERSGFVVANQMERYVRWRREGYLSSTLSCFDIGGSVISGPNEAMPTPCAGASWWWRAARAS